MICRFWLKVIILWSLNSGASAAFSSSALFTLFGFFSEIMDKLVKEDFLSKYGRDTFSINKKRVGCSYQLIFKFIPWSFPWLSFPHPSLSTKPQLQAVDYEFSAVKEEMDGQGVPVGDKAPKSIDEDYMYMKVRLFKLWWADVCGESMLTC